MYHVPGWTAGSDLSGPSRAKCELQLYKLQLKQRWARVQAARMLQSTRKSDPDSTRQGQRRSHLSFAQKYFRSSSSPNTWRRKSVSSFGHGALGSPASPGVRSSATESRQKPEQKHDYVSSFLQRNTPLKPSSCCSLHRTCMSALIPRCCGSLACDAFSCSHQAFPGTTPRALL